MQRQPTKEQLSYQNRAIKVRDIAQGVLRHHNRFDAVVMDGGALTMLDDSANHTLRVPTGPANVEVRIVANWFLDPDYYRPSIEAAVEAAFDPRA